MPGRQDDAELARGLVGDGDGHAAVASAGGLDTDQPLAHGVEQVVSRELLLVLAGCLGPGFLACLPSSAETRAERQAARDEGRSDCHGNTRTRNMGSEPFLSGFVLELFSNRAHSSSIRNLTDLPTAQFSGEYPAARLRVDQRVNPAKLKNTLTVC